MIDEALAVLTDAFGRAQQALFEAAVQPIVFGLGAGNLLEDAFNATGWLIVGLLQIAIIVTVFGALQRWRPVEPLTDRAAVRVDILYTLIHRLGLVRVALFFSIDPLWDAAFGRLAVAGFDGWHLDQAL
ncbi:MAG: fatty acid hydroxylase, partial [Ideonella sp.]|nr:fatty acid hydroxylase [Ideonella sp.]